MYYDVSKVATDFVIYNNVITTDYSVRDGRQ